MKNKTVSKSFIAFSVVYLLIILSGREDIAWYIKPFLIPFLLYCVYKFEEFPTKNFLLGALIFSWIGDIILMFADKGEVYFIMGLVSFLIAHILFIRLFFRQKSEKKHSKNPLYWIGFIGVIAYLISMLTLLIPSLGDLKMPVGIYAMTISIMLVIALKGSFNWANNAKYIILIGAVFFVTSDSILSINKFYTVLPYASFWIMATYLTAQFLITTGILCLNQKNNIPYK